jgi:ABC-type transporter Mla subunit MlaD
MATDKEVKPPQQAEVLKGNYFQEGVGWICADDSDPARMMQTVEEVERLFKNVVSVFRENVRLRDQMEASRQSQNFMAQQIEKLKAEMARTLEETDEAIAAANQQRDEAQAQLGKALEELHHSKRRLFQLEKEKELVDKIAGTRKGVSE